MADVLSHVERVHTFDNVIVLINSVEIAQLVQLIRISMVLDHVSIQVVQEVDDDVVLSNGFHHGLMNN